MVARSLMRLLKTTPDPRISAQSFSGWSFAAFSLVIRRPAILDRGQAPHDDRHRRYNVESRCWSQTNQASISECLHTTSTQPYERRGPERGSPSNCRPGLGGRQDSRFGSSPACYLAPLELNWKSSSYKRFSRLSQPGISPKPPSRSP